MHRPIEFDPEDANRGALPSWPARTPALWIVDAVRHGDRAERLAPGILDAGEQRRAESFVASADRRCYVAAHVALRILLGARLGVEPHDVRMVREPCPSCGGPHGRPATDGGVHFSLSHSRDLSLLAFAAVPLGVDVEAVPASEAAAEIGAMLHPAESRELAALPASDRPAAFARAWTRKEAYLKGEGIGLARDLSLDHLGTGPVPRPGPAGWTVADVLVPAGYAAAGGGPGGGGPPGAGGPPRKISR
ncbi:4'-phosphopantetheinyl transferase family protein, partial [Streptomyces sp. NPDC056661]|uniref:4'-phosphopantetheinyl transferase family protein n=1 Tax=Streptomyces sp. NPDC056661 TaxID=3345898 RepID=UPI00369C3D18